ncbi:TPA: hypothetical protein QB298_000170 [Pasteurella multocida]|nr:hypothetical protein [Pasteurella multocida]
MRLNKEHKNLILIRIVNQTISPLTEKIDELEKRFQEWVYSKADPCFKQYQELYGGSFHKAYMSKNGYCHTGALFISVKAPNDTWLKSQIGDYYISLSRWKPSDDSVLNAIVDDFAKTCEKQEQYEKDLENLGTIVNNCPTDTQLLEMFPEFKSIISGVCVSKNVAKQLPATVGLPKNLERWGMKLNEENTGSSNSINDTES